MTSTELASLEMHATLLDLAGQVALPVVAFIAITVVCMWALKR